MIGTRLGPYEINAKLGEGGMGEVYRATDTKLHRDVAIKLLPAAFTEDKERLQRFEREAQLLAQLNHPNIAGIHGLEESGATKALVMELVEGPTLADRLEQGSLSMEESLSIARQIAEALEEAHEKGIVHRDLKPQNIKASREGKVKVLDFGLAKAMDPLGAASGAPSGSQLAASPTLTLGATVQGVILGTAAYMSPEQAKGLPVDKRADIWAFGVVLYEMLTGARLFAADTVPETLAGVLKNEIDLSELPAEVPPAIRRLLRRCLERRPRQRLHDIADARLVIEDAISGEGRDEGGPVSVGTGRERVAWAVAGLLAVIALGTALWAIRKSGEAPATPKFSQLTFAAQFISNARFAADGRTVVFSAAPERSRSELFARYSEDPQARRLGKGDLQLLSVSSTGELAVLTGTRYQGHNTYLGTLARMPLAEASPRQMLDDVSDADWSPDGSELAVIRRVGGKSRLEYPIGNVLAEASGYLSDLRISPRGDRIAFVPHEFADDNRGRLTVVGRSGSVLTSSSEYWGILGAVWSEDGDEVFFSALDATDDDSYAIRALSMDGSVRKVLAAPAGLVVHDRTPDGRLLIATRDEQGTVYAHWPGSEGEREVPWLDQSYQPTFSRDGRSLLFGDASALAGSFYAVMFVESEGLPPVRLGDGNGTDISPDGASVLSVVMDEPPRLMLYPTGAGEARDLSVPGFVAYETRAQFLGDGRRIAYCGNAAGQPSRCFVRDLASGSIRAVTPEGTREGRVSPDGSRTLARGEDGRYRLYDDAEGEGTLVPGIQEGETVLRWRADGRSVFVNRWADLPVRVDRLDVETGERALVRRLEPPDRSSFVSTEGVSFSEDESAWAFGVKRKTGYLYTVDGLP